VLMSRRRNVNQALPKTMFQRPYYKGGFDEVMSKREAALILGVRYVSLSA